MPENPYQPPKEAKPGRIAFISMLAFAVFVLLSAGYFGAYVALGEFIDWRGNVEEGLPTDSVERTYPEGWMATVFQPAAAIEARLIGCPVDLTYTEEFGPALIEQ